jgi:hypothetical protein
MKKIYKYEILTDGKLLLPNGAIVRKVAAQGDSIFLWAEVDPDRSRLERCFEVFATGQEITEGMGIDRVYLDTLFIGAYVCHVYERI